MPDTLREKDWELLLMRIKDGTCTPFLGAGACYGVLPLACDVADKWSKKYKYPLKDSCNDLARVAQYLAVEYDSGYPKRAIKEFITNPSGPDFKDPDEPHSALAKFPLPVYITTNYDDFMFRALKFRGKNPRREFCRWDPHIKNLEKWPTILDRDSEEKFNPTEVEPVVFHLHGIIEELNSLVLTEDNYFDFLINIAKEKDLIPPRIQEAFAGTSLLFLGYGLTDWNFRVIFRSIVEYLSVSLKMTHISVQLVPGQENVTKEEKEKAKEYLNSYFGDMKIRVYWGTCHEFIKEMKKRWEEYNRE